MYRFVSVEGFDQAFVQGHDFGAYMDTVLMGKINPDGWVAVNCIPTAAHTIWGVLAGKLLMDSRKPWEKIKILGMAGVIGIVVGYGMDWTGLTPIIKRICTSSFVIVSGGWCLVTLAFCYWLVDVKGTGRWITFFTVVGMNSIFIYMFSNTAGMQWFNGFVAIFVNGFLDWFGVHGHTVPIASALVTLGLEWYFCYWLYKRKIFIKI